MSAKEKFLNLNLGWDDSLNELPEDRLDKLVDELETADINLETDEGVENFRRIVEKHENAYHFGTADYKGTTYTITQMAYATNSPYGGTWYKAAGTAPDGTPVEITWDTKDGFDDHKVGNDGECVIFGPQGYTCMFEDESEACDWDSPISVVEVG